MTKARYLLASDWWICQDIWIYKYDPTRKQTGVTASPDVLVSAAPFSSLLLQRSWEKVAAGTLRSGCTWCWGGGRKGGRKKNLKRTFFFSLVTKASHMGGTRPSDLTKGWIGWSQWAAGRCVGATGCRDQKKKKKRPSVIKAFSRLWRN